LDIRAGFEPFRSCGNIDGSKPARFNKQGTNMDGRAEFFAPPVTFRPYLTGWIFADGSWQ
jgi:hypothetical protein